MGRPVLLGDVVYLCSPREWHTEARIRSWRQDGAQIVRRVPVTPDTAAHSGTHRRER